MIIKDTGSIGMCLVVWLLVGLASWAQAACIAELVSRPRFVLYGSVTYD